MKKVFTLFILVYLVSLVSFFVSCKGDNSYYKSPEGDGARFGSATFDKEEDKFK